MYGECIPVYGEALYNVSASFVLVQDEHELPLIRRESSDTWNDTEYESLRVQERFAKDMLNGISRFNGWIARW